MIVPHIQPNVATRLRNFDKVYRACGRDRFFFYPSILREATTLPEIILWGLRHDERDLGHYEQMVRAVLDRNPSTSLVAVVGAHASDFPLVGHSYISYEDFFANHTRYRAALVVDRTCTWQKETNDRAKLEQLGFTVVRFEHFLMSPRMAPQGYRREQAGCNVGNYHEHSDTVMQNTEALLRLVDLFADDKSKCVYLAALMGFASMDFRFFYHADLNPNEHRYVPSDIDRPLTDREIFVDCGAYDGADSINFMKRVDFKYREVHLFEPESGNFRLACDTVIRFCVRHHIDHVYMHHMGVSDANRYVNFDGTGIVVMTGTHVINSGRGIFVTRLDDALDDASWIKLEVEGSELPALAGGINLINKCAATVSVSVYHKPTDFLDILPFMRERMPNHRLYLRHSGLEPGTLCITGVPT